MEFMQFRGPTFPILAQLGPQTWQVFFRPPRTSGEKRRR